MRRDTSRGWHVRGGVGDVWGMLLVLPMIVIDESSR